MTKPKRPTVRVFVEEELAEGQSLVLPEAPSHYLRNVMRKSVGDTIGLFNGRSAEFAATLTRWVIMPSRWKTARFLPPFRRMNVVH